MRRILTIAAALALVPPRPPLARFSEPILNWNLNS